MRKCIIWGQVSKYIKLIIQEVMEIFIPNFRIEKSLEHRLIEDKVNSIIDNLKSRDDKVISGFISGQPVHVWELSKEFHFNECEFQINRQVNLTRLWWQQLPTAGHNNIPPKFLIPDGFPAVQCFDMQGVEYIMGMHSVFGFELELISDWN